MAVGIPLYPLRPAGTRITASIYEGDITDSINYLTNPPIFSATQATIQPVANGTWVPISLDASVFDTYFGHSNSVNNTRWTCPNTIPGKLLASGVAVTAANGTGNRGVRLQINGTAVAGSAEFVPAASAANGTGVATPMMPVTLNGGDYLEVAVWQNSGGALNTAVFSDLTSSLSLVWVHV